MRALKFTISGKTAFFKVPDVNTYLYYSYGNLPRVALLGMLGAVLGMNGYSDSGRENYPEFYEKLKDLNIAICPNTENGNFSKKLQKFNNSTAFASAEAGGNLIVKQIWLENVSWDIFIEIKNEISEKLADYFVNRKSVYIPYLGSNDHIANIDNVEILDLECIEKNVNFVNSYLKTYDFEFKTFDSSKFKYEENLPWELEENTERYITEKINFTNMEIELNNNLKVYSYNNKNLVFYGN